MANVYGSIYRFLLGTFLNRSARTTVEKTCKTVQYKVFDQYKQKYIRKLGNRYTYKYKLFDVTTAERTYLLSLNGTRQTFQPFYDTDYSASVYCDVIFNELTYFPQSFMDLTLTFVDVDTNPAIAPNTITITAPNGGESYIVGNTLNITWSSYNITGNVDIELWKSGVFYDTIVSDTANDGLYAWTIDTDYLAGTDYKIKIRDTNTGLISDFSDADFTIESDGYYHFDGTDDSVLTPLTSIMAQDNDTFIYECDFNLGSTNGEIIFFGNTNGARFHLNATTTTYYGNAFGWNGMYRYYYTNAYTRDNQWHHLEATLVLGASGGARPLKSMVVKVDGVTIAGLTEVGGGAATNGYDWSIGKAGANYTAEFLIKNIEVTTSQSSVLDGFIYRCNDVVPAGSEPYTDYTQDTSAYNNPGTPVGVETNKATFFNQTGTGSHIAGSETFISQSLQPSLCPDSIMPKVVFGAYEYTFDNIQLEYEKRNMIDWEAESITGRLHRRYLTDASGNIRQESVIKINMYGIDSTLYTLLSRFDRQIVEYYPHASDGGSLYLAYFSVEWLTETFDFAEITIEPIGNLISMSLSLTSPNGSESWKANTSQEITWISTGLLPSANVKLELYKNSVLDSVITASTPNDGSYAWTIPYVQTVGADYKIKISGVEHTSVTDLSDADFAVTTPDLNTAGKGNGTDIYIDSGIKANAITDFEIDFVWQDLTSGADVLFGARYTLSYPDRIFYIQRDTAYTYVYFGNPSTDYIRYTSSVLFTNGNRYRIKISIVGTAITVTLTDLNSDIVIRTDSDTIGTLPNYNAYVFAKNNRDTAIENYTELKIIRFKINTEEWNFSAGSGTTTTGSLGTVLNIAGTLTNFWTSV